MDYPAHIQILFESGDGDVPYVVTMERGNDDFGAPCYRCSGNQSARTQSDVNAVKRALDRYNIPLLTTYGKKAGKEYLHSITVAGEENIQNMMELEFVQSSEIADFA